MTALVKCVVPIITLAILARSTPAFDSTFSSASSTPEVTSSVVAAFTPASTSRSCMTTASVLVPPTSIPRRYTAFLLS
jgi:hypothetical protein